jgi:hypothetical protein
MGGACSTHGRDEKYIKILVGNPEGKRPVGRPRVGGLEDVDWVHLVQNGDRKVPVGTVMNLRVA